MARGGGESSRRDVEQCVARLKSTWCFPSARAGCSICRIVDLQNGGGDGESGGDLLQASHRIEFTEPTYHNVAGANPEFVSDVVRFQYESFVTPRSVFDYDVRTRQRVLLKQQPVLGGTMRSLRDRAAARGGWGWHARADFAGVQTRHICRGAEMAGRKQSWRAVVAVWIRELWDFPYR